MEANPGLQKAPTPAGPSGLGVLFVRTFAVLLLLFVFLLGVKGLGEGFKLVGRDLLESFFEATSNPFIGLMVGILATTMVQSSSVTTSMIVGLVAAPENPMPVANAVPMVMGANIGTTVTNTIVSMAHMGQKAEFRRAFAVATCHDFFNYMAVLVFLPLELATGYLRSTAATLAEAFRGVGGVTYESPIKSALSFAFQPIEGLAQFLFDLRAAQAVLVLVISGLLIFGALMTLVRVMRAAMETRLENFVTKALRKNMVLAILVGVAVTVMVQSSSITTSLLVPLGGAGLITLQQAFPITVGANIGTTVTALLASLAGSGANAQAGVTIALVHLLFNLSGMALILPFPKIREVPLSAARWLAETAVRSRRWAFIYVIALFYGLPAMMALLDRAF